MYSDQSVPKDDKFILGTDNLGRNLAKRVIVGIRISLLIAIVATLIMMTVPSAIMYEAVLSAINLGVKPPIVSLGSLITDASENLQYYSYQVLISALALVFISLAFILLGEDGLRYAFDLKSNKEN